jgi:hypothetical protein
MRLWPEPQYSEHSIGKVPARLATNETATGSPPLGIGTLTLNALIAMPWSVSAERTTRSTTSPRVTSIRLGSNL